MKLQVENTELEGVKLITAPTIFDDFRGDYIEIFNKELYENAGIKVPFVQENYATSFRNVLRGIHGDDITTKLVKCIFGSVYVVIVNNDPSLPQYKKWVSFCLNSSNRKQVLVPPKFGTSYLVISDVAIFHYKQSSYYHQQQQFTVKWNDPEFGIWWPITNPITSKRDS